MAVVTTSIAAYQSGKTFLSYAKSIFKKDIKPKIGAHVYRYTDHPIGWFSFKTGQFFGAQSSVLVYYKTLGYTVSLASDGLVYLSDTQKFAGYRLANGKLYDANVVKAGDFVPTEGARIQLAKTGAYNELPSTGIPAETFKITPGSPGKEAIPPGSAGEQKFDITRLIVPAVGIGFLLLKNK